MITPFAFRVAFEKFSLINFSFNEMKMLSILDEDCFVIKLKNSFLSESSFWTFSFQTFISSSDLYPISFQSDKISDGISNGVLG